MLAAAGARADPIEDFYRGRTVFALVGVSPGGEYDFQLRLVARFLSKYIPGHPTIVAQNMTGATGMVMANYLYRVAPKDGTYIGLIQNGLPTSQAVGLEGVQFDARRYNWIGSIAPTVETMVTWKTTSVTTIAQAREKEIVAGSVGSSGITLAFPMMLNDLVGTKFKMVMGYTGSGPLNIAMENGEIAARNASWNSWKAAKPDWLANRSINLLTYSGPKPADLNGVPALESLVKPGEDADVMRVVTAGDLIGHPFAAPPETPPERVAALRKAFSDMERDADFVKEAAAAKLDIDPVSPDGIQQAIAGALDASGAAKARAQRYLK